MKNLEAGVVLVISILFFSFGNEAESKSLGSTRRERSLSDPAINRRSEDDDRRGPERETRFASARLAAVEKQRADFPVLGHSDSDSDSENDDVCDLPEPDWSPCNAHLVRYRFDSIWKQECKWFIYGGCKGNANLFLSMRACLRRCPGSFFEDRTEEEAEEKIKELEETAEEVRLQDILFYQELRESEKEAEEEEKIKEEVKEEVKKEVEEEAEKEAEEEVEEEVEEEEEEVEEEEEAEAAPTGAPTGAPNGAPTGAPNGAPSGAPTGAPTGAPNGAPAAS